MDVNDIADLLLHHSQAPLTHRKLQKLLYLAQGFHLAQSDMPLFDNDLQAWKFGPVNQSIWHRFKQEGYFYLPKPAAPPVAGPEVHQFLVALLAIFGGIAEPTLIDFSHVDKPWAETYVAGANRVLEKDHLRDYFSDFTSFEDYVTTNAAKVDFSQLLERRKAYISTLPGIGETWSMGAAKPPAEDTVSAARHFLHSVERALFSSSSKPEIPDIRLGPIPTGGIGIDLIKATKSLYVHFHNDGNVEVAEEHMGNFQETDTKLQDFADEFGVYLEDFL